MYVRTFYTWNFPMQKFRKYAHQQHHLTQRTRHVCDTKKTKIQRGISDSLKFILRWDAIMLQLRNNKFSRRRVPVLFSHFQRSKIQSFFPVFSILWMTIFRLTLLWCSCAFDAFLHNVIMFNWVCKLLFAIHLSPFSTDSTSLCTAMSMYASWWLYTHTCITFCFDFGFLFIFILNFFLTESNIIIKPESVV